MIEVFSVVHAYEMNTARPSETLSSLKIKDSDSYKSLGDLFPYYQSSSVLKGKFKVDAREFLLFSFRSRNRNRVADFESRLRAFPGIHYFFFNKIIGTYQVIIRSEYSEFEQTEDLCVRFIDFLIDGFQDLLMVQIGDDETTIKIASDPHAFYNKDSFCFAVLG